MPKADQDATVRAMRERGETWRAIGRAIGSSHGRALQIGRRLGLSAPVHYPPRIKQTKNEHCANDNRRAPLPAGHPATWGRISAEPFPHPLPERLRA
jgi:hypothetical protein